MFWALLKYVPTYLDIQVRYIKIYLDISQLSSSVNDWGFFGVIILLWTVDHRACSGDHTQ